MIQALRNAWRLPDVRNKLLFTIFILIVYQFAAHVPVVGVDRNVLRQVFESGSSAGNLIQVMNLLSGGAVANFSVIANGVYPYITASIIFQLLVPIVPALERIQREPGGQEKIQRYTYFVSIPMAVLQALGQISIFNLATGTGAEIIPGFGFGMGSDILLTVSVLTTMTAGTMFAIWLGELITEQGIGNGISIIIFAGIVALAPQNLIQLLTQQPDRALYNLTLFIVITLLSVVAVVVIQEGVRRVPVQYGRRVRGNRQFAQQDSFIPLRVNPVGMIPLIFAQSIITFPAIIASLFPPGAVGNTIQTTFGNQQGLLYWGTFFLMTVGFTFFYAEVMVGNQNLAENLQRNGGFIPGIRPGKRTEDFIKSTTRRITFVGAFFLGVIAII
ncbi:MAG: preprotein translocase subunit SecY, partial [Chloroflexi bacterium]|nr:preprotein translocase subunit SecY [Chloroflexota bacterium]